MKNNFSNAGKLNRESILIDGLAGTTFGFDNLSAAGLTAAHITVAAHNESFSKTLENIKDYYAALDTHPDKLLLVKKIDDLFRANEEKKVGLILGFQTASPIEEDLSNIQIFKALGIRIIQLTYFGSNLLGDGCFESKDEGLSYFGLQTVRELNRLGIIVDLSHVGWDTAMDTAKISKDPVILSHSNPYNLCPHKRNVPDELIKKVAETGGCIGINGHPALCQTKKNSPPNFRDLLHITNYLVNLVGIEHVSLGLDLFDGFMPWQHFRWNRRYDEMQNPWGTTEGVSKQTDIINITQGLLDTGYHEDDIKKILGENLIRVFRQVWKP